MSLILENIDDLIDVQYYADIYYLFESDIKQGKNISENDKFINLKKSFKRFLPKTYILLNGNISGFIPSPIGNKLINKTQNIIDNNIDGLNITIHTDNSSELNAYTYPAMKSTADSHFFTKLGYFLPVNYMLAFYGLYTLSDANIRANNVKGKIIFNAPNDLYINVFQTKGLVKELNDNQLLSVYLHEIGHWVKYRSTFLKTLFKPTSPISWGIMTLYNPLAIPLLLVLFIISLLIGRLNEYAADQFVNDMGFGKVFKEVLLIMHFPKTKSVKKIQNEMSSFLFKFNKLIYTISPFATHPHFSNRIKRLEEGNTDIELYMLLEKASQDEKTSIIMKSFIMIFNQFDSILSKIIKTDRHLIFKKQ